MKRESLVFSIIIPLEYHRGQADRCLRAWTQEQTFPRKNYEMILVAPRNFPAGELQALRAFLSPHDQLLIRREEHDMPLCAAGANAARGEVLFFTESHCWPESDVLEKSAVTLDAHPEWAGFSGRSIRVTHNRLSIVEADLYEADIEEGMLRHPWRKVLDQCFVGRRDPYFQCGGFDPDLGHFSEWLLAARFYCAGFTVGYAPEIRFHHHYVGDLWELTEFTCDFVTGETRFLAKHSPEPCTSVLDEVPEWTERENWNRDTAQRMVELTLRDGDIAGAFRWLPAAVAGPWFEWLVTFFRTAFLFCRVNWAAHFQPVDSLRATLLRYDAALVHLQRLSGLFNDTHHLSPVTAWTPDRISKLPIAGFHLAEIWREVPFRWSEPAAMIELPIAPGHYQIRLDYLPIISAKKKRLRFYINEEAVDARAIEHFHDHTVLTIEVPNASAIRLGWTCSRANAPGDSRKLGVPLREISWRIIEYPTAR